MADPRDDARAARLHSIYMLHSTAHWQPLVNGYSGLTPASHHALFLTLARFPDEAGLSALEDLGVRYVIVHRDLYRAAEWPAVEQRLGLYPERLRPAAQAGDGLAFELSRVASRLKEPAAPDRSR